MEKVKKAFGAAVSWFGVFWFVIFTIVSFPSFGTVIFLIGLTICLPIPATRNFWNEKGPHGAGKIALIMALIIAGAAMSPRKTTEMPSNASEVVEVEESAPEINNAQLQTEAETKNSLESEQTLEVAEPEAVSEPEPEVVEEPHDPLNDLDPESVEYDALQKLYVTFPLGVSFQEAVEFLDATGLPYSSVKYNGSRVFQVSTEESGTAQKYNKSGLPYVKVHYRYPRDENSANDVLEKYTFERIQYVPYEGSFSFESVRYEIGDIKRLGDSISLGRNLTREEQIAFFYKYKDDKSAFRDKTIR